jgi:hypothetical protein
LRALERIASSFSDRRAGGGDLNITQPDTGVEHRGYK